MAAPAEGADTSEAEIPTYEGASKTDKMPKPKKGRRADQVKPPFNAGNVRRPRTTSKEADFGDQRPGRNRAGGGSSAGREQYVRLRVRVHRGRLSIVDSHLVDGPLGQATGFPAGNAYEVTVGDRLLHAGALPDLGVQRSFSNPEGPPEQRGHYISERSTYEFTARVPAEEVTPDTIGKIAVRLHRVKGEAGVDRIGDAPLAKQLAREMRPIAEVVGLPDSALPEAIERRGGRTPNA
ncbi:MAG: hypothetical protein ACJ75G_06855 [Gaiellaceae bacterium]